MQSLFLSSIKYQREALLASITAGKMMGDCYLRFLEQQSEMFKTAHSHRQSDVFKKQKSRTAGICKPRKVKTPCTGADLQDHYGKRALDVDVEHI